MKRHVSLWLTFALALAPGIGLADPADDAALSGPEEIDVDKIKERYWARGKEEQMNVVQNRALSRKGKIELGASYGRVAGDPFLLTQVLRFSVGYHFTENFSLHANGGKLLVSHSSAGDEFQRVTGSAPAAIRLRAIGELEGRASLVYGKLSLMGATILNLSAYFSVGGGVADSSSGTLATVAVGGGQQIHLTHWFSVGLAYRLYYYRKTWAPNLQAGMVVAL